MREITQKFNNQKYSEKVRDTMQNNGNIQKLYQFDPFPNKVEIPVTDIGDLYVPFNILREKATEDILLEDLRRSSISKFV